MNKVILMGRNTKKVEMRYTTGEQTTAVARGTLAVDRRGKDNGTDFPNFVAFGKTAEFLDKYTDKGTKLVLTGRIQTGSYKNKEGQTVYTTDVVVEEAEFAESKASAQQNTQTALPPAENDWMNIPEGIDEELPFAR